MHCNVNDSVNVADEVIVKVFIITVLFYSTVSNSWEDDIAVIS